MPSAEQLRNRLSKKLKELFQLDQPDLDFGFYRIMHAKAEQVQEFIEKDLLKIVEDAFGQADDVRKDELKAKIEREIQAAREYGVPDPENSPKVKEAQAEYESVKDSAGSEADVYDHLYRFFERYYDAGDFLSRRYYTRETPGKAAPFGIPYNGEEVKLHWANADQYYIKTAEYFTNFTFDLRQTQEFRALREKTRTGILEGFEDDSPLKIHFRIADAAEGEHGNAKATDTNKRFFIIHNQNPVEVSDDGELVINFEYRPDPEKSGKEKNWREKRNAQAVEMILGQLETMILQSDGHRATLAEYLRLLTIPAPTEKDKKRPVLAKYVNKYTASNTMDYFIHKDLGGFLRRELDFYIKNEVMRLDDIEDADAPAVESYLAKIRVLRKIAGKLISFLAQLEDFQKKLWLKKKFVVETNYCITLDRVPEELYVEVAANEAQYDDWKRLFTLDEIEPNSPSSGSFKPLKVSFLRANKMLVLDTRFYNKNFKAKLLATIENIDKQCDGLLIHSENYQALNLINERYRGQVKCVYIDPPYNTGGDDFLYKDGYQESSWLSLIEDRVIMAKPLLNRSGTFSTSIDIKEISKTIFMLDLAFGQECRKSNITVKRGSLTGAKVINPGPINISENVLIYSVSEEGWEPERAYREKEYDSRYGRFLINPEDDYKNWEFSTVLDQFAHSLKIPKQKLRKELGEGYDQQLFKFVVSNSDKIVQFAGLDEKSISKEARELKEKSIEKPNEFFHLPRNGVNDYYIKNGQVILFYKDRLQKIGEKLVPAEPVSDIWDDVLPNDLHNEGGVTLRKGKKPEKLIHRIFESAAKKGELILDYFAGTATSGAVAQKAGIKWINIEHGQFFNDKPLTRLKNTLFGEKSGISKTLNWSGGGFFKYLSLESYEDTLNNLRFNEKPERHQAVAANTTLKEDYMLHYLLDVETKGSQSLLNIDAFADPTAYSLAVKKPGSDEVVTRCIDLIETFNFLVGLRVTHIAMPQSFNAEFKRTRDPDLPEDQHTKLVVDGRVKQDAEGPWWFRKIEGWVPMDAAKPNNGQREKVLIVWRKLTGDLEKDNLMLDEWFQKNRISTRDFEFDTIYVNGSNNLPNLKLDDENWKVRLIEEDFMKRMWDVESV